MKKRVSSLAVALALGLLSLSRPGLAQNLPAAAPVAQLSQGSQSSESLRQSAEESVTAGDRKTAIKIYQSLAEAEPSNYDIWMRLGRLLSWEKLYDEALSAYQKALDISPGNRDTRLEMAQVYAWKGELKQSLDMYQAVVDEDPANRDARLGLARALARSNRYRESGDLYSQLLRSNAGDLEARMGIAQVASWDERFDEALATYREVLATDPGNLEARLGEAKVLRWRGDAKESVELYRGIVEDHPDSAEAHQGLGEVRAGQGMDREALEQLRRAVEINPELVEARESLRALEDQHRPELAPLATVARDSDTNQLSLLGADLSFDADPQNRIRLSYRNFGTFNERQDTTAHADLVIAGLTSRISPEVTLRAHLGTASLNPQGLPHDQLPVGGLNLQLTPNGQHSFNVGYSRDALLETPQLISNSLAVDTIDAGYRANLSPADTLSLGFARSTFSDQNTSNLYQLSYSHRLLKSSPNLRVGYNQKFLEYQRQTFNGYFSPPTFQVGEVFLELEQRDPKDPWIYWLGSGAGYQKIFGEQAQFIYRVSGGIGRRIGDSGTIELGGLTSNSALSSVAGFKYNAGTVRMSLRF
jgi:tetratricopeptide (TPR) repeat protein